MLAPGAWYQVVCTSWYLVPVPSITQIRPTGDRETGVPVPVPVPVPGTYLSCGIQGALVDRRPGQNSLCQT